MHARTLTEPRWTPLPHQVPPPGNWYGWLLLAGRGAGKTDACAKYVHDHVMGPPCLPGDTPHWVGIIAPTLGDAATSCVTGPSGLYAHSPGAKMVNTTGGTIVRWPNGSVAKLFGANTEADTERLRSGGNRSIAVGTLVHTERGLVPIEQVTTEDRVWTRLGLRPVLGSWDHGMRPIWTVRTRSGRELRLTPDHKVWTQRGWVRCDHLAVGDTLSSWNTAVTVGSGSALTGHAQSGPETNTGRSSCTDRSTRTTTGPSPRGGTSTTRMRTSRTTTPPTWRPNPTGSTADTTRSPRSGTLLAVERPNGTRSLIVLASSAGPSSTGTGAPGSAPGSAGGNTSSKQPPACSHAVCAEAISQSGASPLLSLAPDVVETISPGNAEGPVWDLTVAGEHEFFAGGLLVSNCLAWLEEMAAWRYLDDAWSQMRFGLRAGPRPHWIASTTPKPRPLIKRLAGGDVRNVVLSRASMYDNPHLLEDIRRALEEEYGSTDLGRQELHAEILDEDSNALWARQWLEASRMPNLDSIPARLLRTTVGVDPSGGAGEQGIVVVAKTMEEFLTPADKKLNLAHGYVLGDRTVHMKPEGWGRRAVEAAVEFQADDIAVEVNFGGEMAVSTIRAAADRMGLNIPVKMIRATRGKSVRAQPVSALSSQNRWHIVGVQPELEDQLCTWYPELDWSPDRLDAMVWPAWHNRIVKLTGTAVQTTGGMSQMQRAIG